jgi:hypothetical protein
MSREWRPVVLRRLILQSVWGWSLVAVSLGAGEPAPKRVTTARPAASLRDVIRLRDPTDSLRVKFNRPHLIFDPQEDLRATVTLDLVESRETNGKPAKALLKWKLLPAGHSRSVAAGTVPVVLPAGESGPAEVPLEFVLPREEGVYELHLTASGRRHSEAELAVQLMLFDRSRPSSVSETTGPEKLVDSFVPATSLFRKVAIDRSLAKVDQPLSRFLKFSRRRDEPSVTATESGDSSAIAYRLKVSHPGRPHRLELSLSGTTEQAAVCRLLESDGQGKFVPLGPQTAISVGADAGDKQRRENDSTTETYVYRQIFWPNDREPTVLIAGRHADHPIEINRVELYEMGDRLPAAQAAWAPATGRDQSSLQPRHRLVGLHLQGPESTRDFGLTRLFGAPQFFDAGEKRLVDDWQTYLAAGHRLAEYLHYQQHNALLLAVLADGGTIYPSRLIEPPLRNDKAHDNNGVPSANGEGPSQKDVLELYLRLFDREGLALVPELHFDSPLSDLERLIRDQPDTSGDLQLVNAAGRTRVEVDAVLPNSAVAELARDRKDGDELNSGEFSDRQRSLPRPAHRVGYNILSPRVQQAVLEATRELVERYSAHASFGGLAFELGVDTVLQLPGIEWGYDPETVRRFEQTAHLQVPRAGRPAAQQQAAYRYLTTTARREWIRYRSGEVARFHRKLAELVLAAKPDAQVFFSGRLWAEDGSDTEGAVLEFVRGGGGPAQLLLLQGLDFSQAPYATDTRVTVLRPLVQLGSDERLLQAAAASLNHSPAIDALYRVASPGGLLYSPAIESQLSPLDVDTRRGAPSAALRPPESRKAVQNYAHLLATLDAQAIFDGSGAIHLGPADSTRRMRTAIAALPSLVFRPAGPQPQPLVVRTAQQANITWLYAVNDSSLPLAIELDLDCPAGTVCRMLDGSRAPVFEPAGSSQPGPNQPATNQSSGNKVRLHIDLRGNDLWACRFERAGVAVIDTRLALSGETLSGVEHRIDRLTAKMHAVASVARAGSRQLPNPGFEQQGARTTELPGWELPVAQAGWSLDEDNPRSGHRSLAISAEADKTALASPPLALEGNRFVTMSLWLRSNKPSARVRIEFEATVDGEPFRYEEPVEAGASWQQHVFRVDPLPAGTMQNARLSVRPVDSCKLWVDDVEIGAQSYSSDEVRQLTKTLSSVKLAWEAGRYADCQRLLDGYWGQLLLAEPAAASPVSDKTRLSDRPRNRFRR